MSDEAGTGGTPEDTSTASTPKTESTASGNGEGQDQPAVDRRPRPAYGEYAPEGWKGMAETASESTEQQGSGQQGSNQQGSGQQGSGPSHIHSAQTPSVSSGRTPTSGRVPGVPHNLGIAGGSQVIPPAARPTGQPGQGAAPSEPTRAAGEPYRAASPQNTGSEPQASQQRAASPDHQTTPFYPGPAAVQNGAPASAPKKRTGDRVITIVLLVLGAYMALSFADSLFRIDAQFTLLADMLGIEQPTVPDWVHTMCLVGAIAVLLLYALTLIYSVQRMRAGKLTFWVPLAAGAIAWLLVSVFTGIAMVSSPEMLEAINDPDALSRMMQYMSENPAG